MPEKITARYRITTPMFIGDAAQQASGISPAAVKGALRFWWRALNWGRIRQTKDTDAEALRQLHKEESELFGSAADQGAGQAKVLIRVEKNADMKMSQPQFPQAGTQYLLGQGLGRAKERKAIMPCDLTLQIALHPHISTEKSVQILDALVALGLLGGLGSRARKGFGSLAIQELIYQNLKQDIPLNLEEMSDFFKKINLCNDAPPYSALSSQSRIDCSAMNKDHIDLLDKVGSEQQLYRSYGLKEQVNYQGRMVKSERNFDTDHDLVLKAIRGAAISTAPKRIIFGLPHNYFFSSIFEEEKNRLILEGEAPREANKTARTRSRADIGTNEKKRDRRASPLFIHVHQFPNEAKYYAFHVFLPATFLPERDEVKVWTKRGGNSTMPFKPDWQNILRYLDRFSQRERVL